MVDTTLHFSAARVADAQVRAVAQDLLGHNAFGLLSRDNTQTGPALMAGRPGQTTGRQTETLKMLAKTETLSARATSMGHGVKSSRATKA